MQASLEDIIEARDHAALLVHKQGEEYLPLFERLETEAENVRSKQTVANRAHEIAMRAAA